MEDLIPPQTVGLCLCKMVGEELRMCEAVRFDKGRSSVLTTLRRARLSGRVAAHRVGDDFWVDLLDEKGDLLGEVGLCRASWNALKNRWMRCSYP